MKKILITGGTGRFALTLKNQKTIHKLFFPNKKKLNITNLNTIRKCIKIYKPDILIHLAGLSRPMDLHNKDIKRSIDLNIIGTANITKACQEKKLNLFIFQQIMSIRE